ncbi:MAG TPA: IPT/TIG domain-containing protein [Bacillota bacterium]|jgi:hypothetical protein|nr:IPT/TIG domain-containing protein [Bacillota bacterium]
MKKLISFLLMFTIIFPLFSDVITVNGAVEILGVRFERIKDPATGITREALYIYGSEFEEPRVRAGVLGNITVTVNEALSDENTIVIDDENSLREMKGKLNIIRVTSGVGAGAVTVTTNVDLQSLPTISGVSSAKVYVGKPLTIMGSEFGGLGIADDGFIDTLYISNKSYNMETECTITGGLISIAAVKDPIDQGVSDIRIERRTGNNEIIITYSNSITVVNELTGIQVERIDPNAGPKNMRNTISIYGQPGFSNFSDDMKIFVDGAAGINKGTIKDDGGLIIGVSFELPTRATAGVVDLVLTSADLGSEFVIPGAFVYLELGNTLLIDSNGINPNSKKETQQVITQIKGRNIGHFTGSGYDKLSGINSAAYEIIGYEDYGDYTMFKDTPYYKVKYTGLYQSSTEPDPVVVTIIRQIRTLISGEATVTDQVYGGIDYTPAFTPEKDTIYVKPPDVTLLVKEPTRVDVEIQTITTIFRETGGATPEIIYNRKEKYVVPEGFTYYPNEIYPEITSVTPAYGPGNKEIYMTIRGKNFQVLEDGTKPRVTIGGRECIVSGVYDAMDKVVDGKIITLGTKIKLRLPAGTPISGAEDVIVINPSNGQMTLINGFEFRTPADETKMPFIDSLKESYADMKGGVISGERVLITGGNIFTSADETPRVVITIDGEKADIVGKVSSDGKTVTIIPPPGTTPGMTKLQIINEDGSMTDADFEYKLITTQPKITRIVPTKGGKGTKLIIKGEDFVLPDHSVDNNDPKKKGSVVLLGGIELNAYKYDSNGVITNVDPGPGPDPGPGDLTSDIYFHNVYDPDGPGPLPSYTLDGHMVKVQDITTIYVDLPERFYSFVGGAAPVPPYLKSEKIPVGSLKVEVLNPDGARSKEDIRFNYMDPATKPVIASVTPNSGAVAGGTVVTITGSGFKESFIEVYFGSEKSESVEYINGTLIRATVPDYPYALPAGQDFLDVPVMVLNYDGGAAVLENGFRYRIPGSNPVIVSITPNNGSSAGNDRVLIEGLDFRRTADFSDDGLPKVYFNGREAEVIWPALNTTTIAESLTVITPPSLTSGAAEVILVNHDSGTCIYRGFTYVMSRPSITSVMPERINRRGNVNVQINGSGFRAGSLENLFASAVEKADRHVSSTVYETVYAKDVIETLAAFGDFETGDKRIIDTVVGPTYAEIGDLRFDCEVMGGATERVNVRISLASDSTHSTIRRYRMDGDVKTFDSMAEADITIGSSHLFIINHEMDLNKPGIYDEGILVETSPSSVTITRRIAPYADIQYDGTQLTVKAPPTDRLGQRNLYVINDDGGKASKGITIMSPDSSPWIFAITPVNKARDMITNQIVDFVPENIDDYSEIFTFVPLDGGAFMTISGSDFRRNVKVYLDDRPVEILSKSINDDQLVIKVPPGAETDLGKDLRIVVVNEDGGTYDSSMLPKPHYIRYQTQDSNPVIERIVPNKSSSRGSNYIAIHGNNFRAGVKVFIEGVEGTAERGYLNAQGQRVKESEYLSVLVPTGLTPGSKTVQVLNTDFGFTELRNGLTIISTPEITAVYDDRNEEIRPLVLSVEGGEKIRLEGIQFMAGIKVIFGGTLKAKSELAEGESGLEGLNINNAEMVVIGGTVVTDAVLNSSGDIICTTPKLDMGQTSIIVINSDGGISNKVEGVYQKPVPDTPRGIKVEAVDGDTLKLEWDKVEDVSYYELYAAVSEDGKSVTGGFRYLGSIVPAEIGNNRLRYYLDGLMPSTWYNIRIRSVNLFGASNYSTSTGYTKTLDEKTVSYYMDETEYEGGLQQKDSVIVNGMVVTYTIGEKSAASSSGAKADFNQPQYVSADQKIVRISFGLLKKYPKSRLSIIDRDLDLSMNLSTLDVEEVSKVENSLRSDADMRVILDRSSGPEDDQIRIRLPRGYKIIMNPFGINLNMQVQNTATRIKSFNGDAALMLNYAGSKKSLYPGGIYIAYYDKEADKIQIMNTADLNGRVRSQISKTGEYVLIGKLVK